MFSIEKTGLLCHIGYHLNWLAIDRKEKKMRNQESFVAKTLNYDIFVEKTRNYNIFVAKIYDYALIDSF